MVYTRRGCSAGLFSLYNINQGDIMKKEKLYDVICSKSDAFGNSETYTRTVGLKLPLKEAQESMLDDALSEIEYNGHIYVGKEGEEFEYSDYDTLKKNVTSYLKRHSIGKSLSIEQWDNEVIDYSIVEHKEPAQTEVWTVAWAEFDGWNSELYTGSLVFKSKEEAIAWVENDYNQELAEKFGQDPDDNHNQLKLNNKKIDGLDNKIDFPKCENIYRKWTINKSTL
jgi:hypothetical protein